MRRVRHYAAHYVLRFGLWLMPPGRAHQELTQLLWTWNMKIQMTIAANAADG